MVEKETTIISLGGSIVVPDKEIDVEFLRKFRRLILNYVGTSRTKRVVIICGGGGTNRLYNKAVHDLVKPRDVDLDWLGIMTTRLNAEFVRILFGEKAHDQVIYNPTIELLTSKSIIVGAGWVPGCSTDKDAVLSALNFGARTILNLSNIDYVYDKDPRVDPKARPYEHLTWKQIREIVGDSWSPRLSMPFDPIAVKLAQREKLRVVIMNGYNLKNVRGFLTGKKYQGTTIQ